MTDAAPSTPPASAAPARRLRAGHVLILLVCFGLILADNLINIGRTVEELTKQYVFWRFTPLDFGVFLSFLWAAFHRRDARKFLWTPPVVISGSLVLFATLVGALHEASTGGGWLLFDLRVLLCLVAGIILGSVMVNSGRFLRIVAIFACIAAVLLVYAGTSAAAFMDAWNAGLGTIRVVDPSIFYYWEFLLIPCALLGVRRGATTRVERVAFWSSLAALVFMGVMVSATRSCLFTLLVMIPLLSLVGLKRREFKGLRIVTLIFLTLGIGAAGFYTLWAVLKPKYRANPAFGDLTSLVVVDRMRDLEAGDQNVNYRAQEVRQLWRELRPMEVVIGKGLGATIAMAESGFVGEQGFVERTPTLHISIFNFLLKFGVIGFVPIAVMAAFIWPRAFVRAVLQRGRDRESTAVLVTYPAVGSATALMCMSGGYTPQIFLWLGITYAYFIDTRLRGARAVAGGAISAEPAGRGGGAERDRQRALDRLEPRNPSAGVRPNR